MAANRTTRKKAVPFMLLEEWLLLSHAFRSLPYIGHIPDVFRFLCDKLSCLRRDNVIYTIVLCKRLEHFSKSYEYLALPCHVQKRTTKSLRRLASYNLCQSDLLEGSGGLSLNLQIFWCGKFHLLYFQDFFCNLVWSVKPTICFKNCCFSPA